LGQQVLARFPSSVSELLDARQVDGQVVTAKTEHPRRLPWHVLDDRAVAETQNNGVAIFLVGQEPPLSRGDRQNLPLLIGDPGEDAHQLPSVVAAFLDPQGNAVFDGGELADPDRCTQGARTKLEIELLVTITGQRLPITDDG